MKFTLVTEGKAGKEEKEGKEGNAFSSVFPLSIPSFLSQNPRIEMRSTNLT
jgi:hypothetical protein